MAIDQKLSVLQQFTADTGLLRKAVDRATSGLYAEFPNDSDRIKTQLQQQIGSAPDGRPMSEQIQEKADANVVPSATMPWFASRQASAPRSAVTALSASSALPNVAYSAHGISSEPARTIM